MQLEHSWNVLENTIVITTRVQLMLKYMGWDHRFDKYYNNVLVNNASGRQSAWMTGKAGLGLVMVFPGG